MTPIAGQNQIVVISDDSIALRPKPGRRTVYLLLFLLLVLTAVFGFDPARDLSGGRLVSTVGFIIVAFVLLGVGGISTSLVFNRAAKTCTRKRAFFWFSLSSEETKLGPEAHIVCQDVELMKRPDSSNNKTGMLSGFLTARTHLFRLFLEANIDPETDESGSEDRIKLDETTYPEGISELGKAVADFMGIPFESEQM